MSQAQHSLLWPKPTIIGIFVHAPWDPLLLYLNYLTKPISILSPAKRKYNITYKCVCVTIFLIWHSLLCIEYK